MKYHSTRGKSSNLSFEQALLQGLAPDGGLYIPDQIPQVSLPDILSWNNLSFSKLAFQLFRRYIDPQEIPDRDLMDILKKSFGTFSDPEVTPMKKLPIVDETNPHLNNIYVLELFHGPTFAFKDVALQFVGNLFDYFLKRRNSQIAPQQPAHQITVLGATSGDTGGAAIYGLRGKENVHVFILHPKGRVSSIQEKQMTCVLDENVHNVAVEGTFDDCQEIVKALFSDASFKEAYHLGAINSINWARILAQTSYYFYSYLTMLKRLKVPLDVPSYLALTKIQYVVPTGNFGDILAGYYALRMGLPIHKLVVATNENDILHRFFVTGHYEKRKNQENLNGFEDVKQTLSPAMDILVSSNFERLMWYLVRGDSRKENTSATKQDEEKASVQIDTWMRELKSTGGFSVPQDLLARANEVFDSRAVSNSETRDCIQRYYHNQYFVPDDTSVSEKHQSYVLDPHTAVGVVATEDILKQEPVQGTAMNTIVLSTASPGKFPEAVLDAINNVDLGLLAQATQRGFRPIKFEEFAPEALVALEGKPKRCAYVETSGSLTNGIDGVRKLIISTVKGGSKL